jgi:hypothetical protein
MLLSRAARVAPPRRPRPQGRFEGCPAGVLARRTEGETPSGQPARCRRYRTWARKTRQIRKRMSSGELPGLQNRRAASPMSPVRSTRTRFRQFSTTVIGRKADGRIALHGGQGIEECQFCRTTLVYRCDDPEPPTGCAALLTGCAGGAGAGLGVKWRTVTSFPT